MSALVERVQTWNPAREPEREFDYIDLSAVDNSSKAITGATRVSGVEAPSRARQLVLAGDVLVSTVRPNLNAVAVVPPTLSGATASTGFTVLRPSPRIDARYLFHWVRSPQFVSDMVRKSTGASYPAVSDRIVKDSLIPTPDLAKQRRIAAILDRADAIRTKRRQAIDHLDDLTHAMFYDMFGRSNWADAPLGQVATTRLGKMLDAKKQTDGVKFPYLRNANVQWFSIGVDDLLEMEFTEAERVEFALQAGDVLVCEGGQPGRAAIWDGDHQDVFFQKALHRVRVGAQLTPEFLVHFLWSAVHGGALKDFVTSATIAHLTGAKLRTVPVPLPPVALQHLFADRLRAIRKRRESVQRALATDDELFASLQTRAFRGEL